MLVDETSRRSQSSRSRSFWSKPTMAYRSRIRVGRPGSLRAGPEARQ